MKKIVLTLSFLFIIFTGASAELDRQITNFMCTNADAIVYAEVLRVQQIQLTRAPLTGIISSIGKKNLIRVKKTYKGAIENSFIEVLTQGGYVEEDIEIIIEGQVNFAKGDTVLLFLTKRKIEPWYYEVLNGTQGLLPIRDTKELTSAEQLLKYFVRFD